MNVDTIHTLARATVAGSMPFPVIIQMLMDEGVEYYHVDYAALSFSFYNAAGAVIRAPLALHDLPCISANFDVTELKAAILDSQQLGQRFDKFCQRAMLAGVQGYFAFVSGQRVVYMGRQGDMHTEWFAKAKQ